MKIKTISNEIINVYYRVVYSKYADSGTLWVDINSWSLKKIMLTIQTNRIYKHIACIKK